MTLRDAIAMLSPADIESTAAATWADLGCGSGLFTRALAELLAPDSTIHAVDRDVSALSRLPSHRHRVRIETHHGDFVTASWPFDATDGILMANSLHYVDDPPALIPRLAARMKPRHRFLVVEYDTDEPNPWVPYPISCTTLRSLFAAAGYAKVRIIATRPSIYQRAALYAADIQ